MRVIHARDENERRPARKSEEGPAKLSDICRLMNRVRELEEDQKRLMRELEESIDATGRLLTEIESRRSDRAG